MDGYHKWSLLMKRMLWITFAGFILSTQPVLSHDAQKSTSYKDILLGSVIGAGLCGAAVFARSKGATVTLRSGAFKTFISELLPWNRKSKEMKNLESQIKAIEEHLKSFDAKNQSLSEGLTALQKDSNKQGRRIEEEVAGLRAYTTHRTSEIKTMLSEHGKILEGHTQTLAQHGVKLTDHTDKINDLQTTVNAIKFIGEDTNLKVTRLDNAVKNVLTAFANYTQNNGRKFWIWSENKLSESDQKKLS